MGDSFSKYLSEGGSNRDEEAEAFRRSRPRVAARELEEDRAESISYEPGSRVARDRDPELLEEDAPIDINKQGKALLLHNMISAGVAGAAKQLHIFFRRLIQR